MSLVLDETQATALAVLLNSISHDKIKSEEGLEFILALDSIKKELESFETAQYEMWLRIGSPNWEQTAKLELP